MTSEKEMALRKSYINSLKDKQKALKACIDQSDVMSMLSLLHKLSGSAGMYGLEDISRQAKELEQCLNVSLVIESAEVIEKFAQLSIAMKNISIQGD